MVEEPPTLYGVWLGSDVDEKLFKNVYHFENSSRLTGFVELKWVKHLVNNIVVVSKTAIVEKTGLIIVEQEKFQKIK